MSEVELWPLEPHSRAKHTILKQYLDRWFPIMGKYNTRLNYIDGFAGPGEYKGGEKGSPILAIESALEHLKRGTLSPMVTINFCFIESATANCDHLKKLVDQMSLPPQFNVGFGQGEFRVEMAKILNKIESEKTSLAPTFAFVDPFGFSGIPFSLMSRILRFPKCEVFINIMVDFINRFLEHPNGEITAHVPETFGTADVLEIPKQPGDRLEKIMALYRRQLRSRHAKFVGRFDMYGHTDRQRYSLFFATNAARGFEKMKEAMWSVDRYGGSKFSDADPDPAYLFESWGFEHLWDELKAKFAGASIPMSTIESFVIEETDYLPTHARKILTQREASGDIAVETMPNCKRLGKTLASDKVKIVFPS